MANDSIENKHTGTEYRIAVTSAYDMRNGTKAGETFYPEMIQHDAGAMEFSINWWRERGHTAVIEERTVTVTYSEWSDRN